MAISMESYFKVALNQFVGHFSEVCDDKDMHLTLKETGDAVKPDLLFRMMYELILSEEPTEDYQPPMPKTKIPEVRTRGEDEVPVRENKTYTGIKVSFKDIKKVEKQAKVQFPFMPDFIDYKSNNSCCQCLRVCGNMFVPCGTNVKDWNPEDGTIPTCKTCMNQKNEKNYGNLAMRMEAYEKGVPYVAPFSKTEDGGSEENVKGPKGPKKEVTFATYLAKKGLLGNDAKHRTAKLNEKIQELEGLIFQETNLTYNFGPEHLSIDKSKVRASKKGGEAKRGRGRPKKERSPSVSSTSSEEETSSPPQSPVHEDAVEENVPEDQKVEVEEDGELDIDEVIADSDVEEEEEQEQEQEEEEEEEQEEGNGASMSEMLDGMEKMTNAMENAMSDEAPAAPPAAPPAPAAEKVSEKVPNKTENELKGLAKPPPKKEAEPCATKATKKLKKVTVKGKVLYIDRADRTVYDENMEFYGEFDKERGKIIPIGEE